MLFTALPTIVYFKLIITVDAAQQLKSWRPLTPLFTNVASTIAADVYSKAAVQLKMRT